MGKLGDAGAGDLMTVTRGSISIVARREPRCCIVAARSVAGRHHHLSYTITCHPTDRPNEHLMRLRSDISLEPADRGAEPGFRSHVACNGRRTSLTVSGSVLETAVDTRSGTLLFVTYEAPYEESLSIVLAGTDWRTRDKATLAVPYANGTLNDVELLPPNCLSFRFFPRRLMRLTVCEKPRCALPLDTLGFAIHRPLQWRRWFRLATA